MATLEGCTNTTQAAPGSWNLRLVLANGEQFVGWECYISGVAQGLPDVTNPGYGVVGAPAGVYDCVGTYLDVDGMPLTENCVMTVTAQPHDGCPTGPVEVGESVELSIPNTDPDATYQHIINGVMSTITGGTVNVLTGEPGTVTVSSICCTGNDATVDSKCESHPCADTTVVSEAVVGDVGDRHSYSKRQAFNCDETLVLLSNGGNGIYNVSDQVQVDSVPITSRSVFSCKDPNLVFGVARDSNNNNDRSLFVSYDIATDTPTTFFDASDYYSSTGCDVTIGDFEGTIQDDRCVVLRVKCPTSGIDELVALDITGPYSATNNNVIGTLPTPTSFFNHAGFDLTCSYIYIASTNAQSEYQIHTPTFNQIGNQSNATGNFSTSHGDFAILPDGTPGGRTGYLTVAGSGENFLDFATNTWISGGSSGDAQNRHLSALSTKNCRGLYLSTDLRAGRDSHLVQVDGNLNQIWELNLGALGSGTGSQAQGAISPCGTYFVYTSSKSGDVRDYIVKLDNSACPQLEPMVCEHYYCEVRINDIDPKDDETCLPVTFVRNLDGTISFINPNAFPVAVVVTEGATSAIPSNGLTIPANGLPNVAVGADNFCFDTVCP